MSKQNTTGIALRFLPEELALLEYFLQPPGERGEMPSRPDMPGETVLNRLIADGIIVPCGEHLFLDRVIGLVLQEMSCAKWVLSYRGKEYTRLHVGEKMCVLVDNALTGPITMEPFANLETAVQVLLRQCEKDACGAEITLRSKDATESYPALAPALNALVARTKER